MYTAGFSVTKTKITLYLYMEQALLQSFLARLGKATAGKSCIYVNRLSDIDTAVLGEMIQAAIYFVRHTFETPDPLPE